MEIELTGAKELDRQLATLGIKVERKVVNKALREGAKVTVRDVSVIMVDDAIGTAENSFTYPCQWVVTARVKHLKHIHDRQNVYLGELSIGIEDDRWKITKLVLKNEERIIKRVWQKA